MDERSAKLEGGDTLAHEADEHARRFGNTGHITFHSAEEKPRPRKVADLFAKPVVRQWISGGKLYREATSRELPRIELFFDLLYVGVIRQLAEVAAETPNGASVGRFILTFWPAWSIWEEARRFSNVSGRDDLLHRLWVLAGMICIVGYAANASAIELHVGSEHAAATTTGEGVASHIAHFMQSLASEAAGAAGGSEEGETLVHQNTAVRAATAFFLIIKLTRVIVLWVYALALPDFRLSQILGGCAVLVPMFVYLPLIWVTSRRAQIGIAIAGMLVDLCRIDAVFYYISSRYLQWRAHRTEGGIRAKHSVFKIADLPASIKLPAINIEHTIERFGAIAVIVLGEMIMHLTFTATAGNYGASPMYGKACLGLMVAWALNYLYTIPSDTNVVRYEHALRHNWIRGVLFNFIHFLLCGSLVLASAASGELVQHDSLDDGVKWFWGCGLGFALLFTVSLDMLHHNLETWRAQTIPRGVRYAVGVAGSLVLILLPLRSPTFTSMQSLVIGVAITWAVLGVYVFGTIATRHAAVEEFHEPEITATVVRTESHHGRSLRSFASAHDLGRRETRHSGHEDDLAVL